MLKKQEGEEDMMIPSLEEHRSLKEGDVKSSKLQGLESTKHMNK